LKFRKETLGRYLIFWNWKRARARKRNGFPVRRSCVNR